MAPLPRTWAVALLALAACVPTAPAVALATPSAGSAPTLGPVGATPTAITGPSQRVSYKLKPRWGVDRRRDLKVADGPLDCRVTELVRTKRLVPAGARPARAARVTCIPGTPVTARTEVRVVVSVRHRPKAKVARTVTFVPVVAPADVEVPDQTAREPTPTPVDPVPAPLAPATQGVSVLGFGAKGDGRTDDTAALRAALAALRPGQTLLLPAGRTFLHSDLLVVTVPDVRISGGGRLLATMEERSAVAVRADRVVIDNITLGVTSTTKRWAAFEKQKLVVGPRDGVRIDSVTVTGSAAAGVFLHGATNFVVSNVVVENTRADGIHMTHGAQHGLVAGATLRNTGDDGVAVVSYLSDGVQCHHIKVLSPRFYGQTWGRAFSVVGGHDILYRDIYAEQSFGASVYIGAEASYQTYGVSRVGIDGGTIRDANQAADIDHGAILLYSSVPGQGVTEVGLRNLVVESTRLGASRQAGAVSEAGGTITRVWLLDLSFRGGPSEVLARNTGPGFLNMRGVSDDGVPLPDVIEWS